MKVLIMGLPGSGKTTLANILHQTLLPHYRGLWLNADAVREEYDDWDFSYEGRIRQAHRMAAPRSIEAQYTIIDMVCPLPEMREIINADLVIWMDTISSSQYEDTNKMFVPPERYDFRYTSWSDEIQDSLMKIIEIMDEEWKQHCEALSKLSHGD